MNLREFMRFHLLKALLGLVALQIGIVAIIQNYNHRPVAISDLTSTIESRPVKIAALNNDTDQDDNTELSYIKVNTPINGSIEQKKNLIIYTPNKGFVGVDSLSYTVTDGKKESYPAYIVIQVNPNLPPLALGDTAQVYTGGVTGISVLVNDSDRESDTLYLAEFSQPLYGKVEQTGDVLTYRSINASALVDSFYYQATDGKNLSEKTWVYITIQPKGICYPWLSADIGNFNKAGSFTVKGSQFIVEASGSDIWENVDGMRMVYQYLDGDFEIAARLESLDATNEWAKAGVMVRDNLMGGAMEAFSLISFKNGSTYHFRSGVYQPTTGGPMQTEVNAPYWVRLVRKGNLFTFYISPSGSDWQKLEEAEIMINTNAYVGLALSNHDNNALAKAVFSQVRLSGDIVK